MHNSGRLFRLKNIVCHRVSVSWWIAIVSLNALVWAGGEMEVSIIPSYRAYSPGDSVVLAVHAKIPPKFHLYGNPLGPGIGKPMLLHVRSEGPVQWSGALKSPAEKFQPDMGEWVWAYEKNAWFFITGKLAEDASGEIAGKIKLDALICHTSCVPISRDVGFSIRVDGKTGTLFGDNSRLAKVYRDAQPMPLDTATGMRVDLSAMSGGLGALDLSGLASGTEEIPEWDYSPVEKQKQLNIGWALLFAFIAGLILNVMPCVLPVLGIKIMAFSQGSQGSRAEIVKSSLSFAAGMITVFMALATLAVFAGYSWGEQFQDPKILAGIICLIFIFALGMFDVFTIIVPSKLANMEHKSGGGIGGDYVKGLFATILATPCSGPFLGATLAWTLTQTPAVVYAVFGAVGAGMAFPYVLLSLSDTLVKKIPKPGKWMDDFKHAMGFLLFGFAVYLLISLPRDMVISTVGFCVFLALALAIYKRYAPFGSKPARKLTTVSAGLIIAAVGFYLMFGVVYQQTSEQKAAALEQDTFAWQKFSPSALTEAHASGRHVMIDFTANWCMNCQFNKITVLHTARISNLIEEKNILPLKADITNENPPAESLMHNLGSRSVPFLAIFPGDDPYHPVIMRDLLDKNKLASTLNGLAEK
ncbi:MAG: hypothetical protein GF398_02955 [Chitinivibrionales bacterium]|nr:hypothetical protein [Chitinivibrionales bacterium]